MAGARWAALAVAAVLAVGVAGCGSSGEDGTDVEKVAFVAPGSDGEPDWTEQAKDVVEEFPDALGIRVDTIDASQADDMRAVFEQVAGEGNQLVIAHDDVYARDAAAVAAETDTPTLVWGDPPPGDGPVAGIAEVQVEQGGYLAGLIASKAAYTRRLAVLVADDGSAWDLANANRAAGGFIAGARSVDPKVKLTYEQIGSDGDATAPEMRAAARRLLEQGVQMLFAPGGRATAGALQAIIDNRGANETLFIGYVGDKSEYPEEVGGVPYLLGSVMWNTRPAFRQAVADVRAGSFGDRDYALTLRNRGVWLFHTGRTPGDAYEDALRASARMERGALQPPSTPTADAIEQLLAGEDGGS